MRTTIGSLSVELMRAEAARFRRPLLFLHGLWTDASIWLPWAGYLSHRGWESWAPSLGADPAYPDHRALVDATRSVLVALPEPPIIVAHDLGVVAALELASAIATPAVVAVAPIVAPVDGGRLGRLGLPRFWRARLGASTVGPPPRSLGRTLVGRASGVSLRPDSGAIFRALVGNRLRLPPRAALPGLVIGGADDPLVRPAAVQVLATRQGWEHHIHPGRGHFPMLEPGWEQVADDVHRWIVRAMGEEILAWLDDEDEP